MKVLTCQSTTALTIFAGALMPAGAFAQSVPRPDNLFTCAAGNSGQTITLPGGAQIGINVPDTLNCGGGSLAGAPGDTAIGDDARATGTNSTALGSRATASFANSTAVGSGAITTAPNQVSLGGPGTSVRIGDIAASTAAQSGPVGLATIDGSGTLGVDLTTLPALRREARQGVAAAVAIGNAPMPSAPGRTSYVFNLATFRGEQAVGGSIMHRLPTSTPFAITAGFSYARNRNNAARVGVAGEF